MNRALLRELLEQAAYPSITLLHPTEPGLVMHPDDVTALIHLAHEADGRLEGDAPDDVRLALTASLVELIERAAGQPSTTAIAICVSPISATVVRLGREVRSRCVIDETFATRDMVADANRTAVFRVLTVSDHVARVFVGDRNRLAEEHTDRWPLVRDAEESLAQWSRAVAHAVRAEHGRDRDRHIEDLFKIFGGLDRDRAGAVMSGWQAASGHAAALRERRQGKIVSGHGSVPSAQEVVGTLAEHLLCGGSDGLFELGAVDHDPAIGPIETGVSGRDVGLAQDDYLAGIAALARQPPEEGLCILDGSLVDAHGQMRCGAGVHDAFARRLLDQGCRLFGQCRTSEPPGHRHGQRRCGRLDQVKPCLLLAQQGLGLCRQHAGHVLYRSLRLGFGSLPALGKAILEALLAGCRHIDIADPPAMGLLAEVGLEGEPGRGHGLRLLHQ
jgi:hypothetical protein